MSDFGQNSVVQQDDNLGPEVGGFSPSTMEAPAAPAIPAFEQGGGGGSPAPETPVFSPQTSVERDRITAGAAELRALASQNGATNPEGPDWGSGAMDAAVKREKEERQQQKRTPLGKAFRILQAFFS